MCCVVRSANVTACDGYGALPAVLPGQHLGQAAGHLDVHQVQIGTAAAGCRPVGKEQAQASHPPGDQPAVPTGGEPYSSTHHFCICICKPNLAEDHRTYYWIETKKGNLSFVVCPS